MVSSLDWENPGLHLDGYSEGVSPDKPDIFSNWSINVTCNLQMSSDPLIVQDSFNVVLHCEAHVIIIRAVNYEFHSL